MGPDIEDRAVAGTQDARFLPGGSTVAVVIPTFNHAHFLADAIASVLAQTRQADEVIVVDDGSTDDVAIVVDRFPSVRLIRQENRGLSAARNTGFRSCQATYVVFLDADDRLLPRALETGLACMVARPDCAFVYGGYRRVSRDWRPIGPDISIPIQGNAYHALLRRNVIGVPAAVLYRRDCLLAVNGFDETLPRNEDYDIYLRIAKQYPIASHSSIIAEYRWHGQNMSNNYVAQIRAVLRRLDAHWTPDLLVDAAVREGRKNIRDFYVPQMLSAAADRWRSQRRIGVLIKDLAMTVRWSPYITARTMLGFLGRRAGRIILPRQIVRAGAGAPCLPNDRCDNSPAQGTSGHSRTNE